MVSPGNALTVRPRRRGATKSSDVHNRIAGRVHKVGVGTSRRALVVATSVMLISTFEPTVSKLTNRRYSSGRRGGDSELHCRLSKCRRFRWTRGGRRQAVVPRHEEPKGEPGQTSPRPRRSCAAPRGDHVAGPSRGLVCKGSAARREIGMRQSWLRSSSASGATSCAIEPSHGERAEGPASCGRRRERRRDRGERSGEMPRWSGSGSGEALRCHVSFCDNHPRCQGPPQLDAKADRLSDKKSDG